MQITLWKWDFNAILAELAHDRAIYIRTDVGMAFGVSYPCTQPHIPRRITKPKMEAVSLGIEVVHNKADLQETISRLVEEFRQPVLVEKFIPGREFAVGLLGNQDPEILPVVEIDLEGDPNAVQTLDDKLRTPRE